MSSVSKHLALVPGDTGRGSSSQKMAVFQTPSTQTEVNIWSVGETFWAEMSLGWCIYLQLDQKQEQEED